MKAIYAVRMCTLVHVGNYTKLTIRLLIESTNEKPYFMLFTKNFEIVCI